MTRHIYDMLEHIEKRPAMFLGNDYNISHLNTYILGFLHGGGKFYHPSSAYPNFDLFTGWIGGVFKYKYENSSANWSGFLSEKYPDTKQALNKFFHYLNLYKKEEIEATIIPVTQQHIEYSIENGCKYLHCGNNLNYTKNLRKLDRIILFKIGKSQTLFCTPIDKNDKVIASGNVDMTGKILLKEIEKQFKITSVVFDKKHEQKGKTILQANKIV